MSFYAWGGVTREPIQSARLVTGAMLLVGFQRGGTGGTGSQLGCPADVSVSGAQITKKNQQYSHNYILPSHALALACVFMNTRLEL